MKHRLPSAVAMPIKHSVCRTVLLTVRAFSLCFACGWSSIASCSQQLSSLYSYLQKAMVAASTRKSALWLWCFSTFPAARSATNYGARGAGCVRLEMACVVRGREWLFIDDQAPQVPRYGAWGKESENDAGCRVVTTGARATRSQMDRGIEG